MAQKHPTQYLSVLFQGGQTQDLPPEVLQLPALRKISNLRFLKQGELTSRKYLQKIVEASNLPQKKLFTHKDQLLYADSKNFFSYDEAQKRLNRISRRDSLSLKIHAIAQKESDISSPACVLWGDLIYCFYVFENQIFYRTFSIQNNRIIGQERIFPISSVGTIQQIDVQADRLNRIWVCALDDTGFHLKSLAPGKVERSQQRTIPQINVAGFYMDNKTIFYKLNSGALGQLVFNPTGADPKNANNLVRNPHAHVLSFENKTLWDFYEWCSFKYDGRRFKLIWSVQTGYFIINEFNQIVAHYHANFVPFDPDTHRMDFYSNTITANNKIYLPILKTGQAEQIRGGSIIYPLGLEILELDLTQSPLIETSLIGDQMLISGAVNSYFNGVDFTEFGFTEKPLIRKTASVDYSRWPYGALLERNLPAVGEVDPTQYREFVINQNVLRGPYNVKEFTFNARKQGNEIGAGAVFGGDNTDRDLRYATTTDQQSASERWWGRVSDVKYEGGVLEVDFTGNAVSLQSGRTYPQAITLNGLLYEFMEWKLNGNTLTAKHRTDVAPLTEGTEYRVKIPRTVSFDTGEISDNIGDNLEIANVKLRKFTDVNVAQTQSVRSAKEMTIIPEVLRNFEGVKLITDFEAQASGTNKGFAITLQPNGLNFTWFNSAVDINNLVQHNLLFSDRMFKSQKDDFKGQVIDGTFGVEYSESTENYALTTYDPETGSSVSKSTRITGLPYGLSVIYDNDLNKYVMKVLTSSGNNSDTRIDTIDIQTGMRLSQSAIIASLSPSTTQGILAFANLKGSYYVLGVNGLYKDTNGNLNFVQTVPNPNYEGTIKSFAVKDNKLYAIGIDTNNLMSLWEINENTGVFSKQGNSYDISSIVGRGEVGVIGLSEAEEGFNLFIQIYESIGGGRIRHNTYRSTVSDDGVFTTPLSIEESTTSSISDNILSIGTNFSTLNFTGITDIASSNDILMGDKVFRPDGDTFKERFTLNNEGNTYTGLDFVTGQYIALNNTSKKIEKYSTDGTFRSEFDLQNSGDTYKGITVSGGSIYALNDTKKQVERYDSRNAFQNSFSLDNQADDYSGIAYNGDSIFAFNETTDKIEEYRNVDQTQEVGFIKETYKDTLNLPSNLMEAGGTVSPELLTGVEVVAFYNDSEGDDLGENLYLAFSTDKPRYADIDAFKSAVEDFFTNLKLSDGVDEFEFAFTGIPNRTSTKDNKWSIIYNLQTPLADNSVLQSIIESFVVDKTPLTLEFVRPAGRVYSEILTQLQPDIFSMDFKSPDAKTSDDIKSSIVVYDETDREILNNFFIDPLSFVEIDPEGVGHRYYKRTHDSPLDVNPSIYDFENVAPLVSILRFVTVDVTFSAAQLLKAHIYQYKCRFKWIDQKGFEHRSPFSDIITIYSNTNIGTRGNQPTFELNNLHLTNKPNKNLTIEVYRTENLLQTFKLIKEVKNNQDVEKTIIRDDIIDEHLGQVADPINTTISGAKFNIKYKGRFVLYGFPEKSNRIIVSSPLSNFSNKGIDFKNQGLPGDLVELLLPEEVICVRQMDQSLIIFCKESVYTWVLNENSVVQREPEEITGLVDLNATNSRSVQKTNMGLLFNSTKGLWTLERGFDGAFTGKDVQDLRGNILEIENIRDAQEVRIITDDENFPILNYNYRFNLFSTYDEGNVVSSCIWKDKYTVVNRRGDIKTEIDTFDNEDNFSIQSGWMNFYKIQGFQSFREFYLLSEFLGLKNLTCRLYYDFDNVLYEEILYDLSDSLKDQSQFRFQPRKQRCRSVRLELIIRAKRARLFGFLIGLTALPGVYLRSQQQQSSPGGG